MKYSDDKHDTESFKALSTELESLFEDPPIPDPNLAEDENRQIQIDYDTRIRELKEQLFNHLYDHQPEDTPQNRKPPR